MPRAGRGHPAGHKRLRRGDRNQLVRVDDRRTATAAPRTEAERHRCADAAVGAEFVGAVPVPEKKGKEVKVLYTDKFVEIYWNNERIALHMRDKRLYKYTTKTEHMPVQHEFYAKWTPERMIAWGNNLGEGVREMIEGILKKVQHPEQGYKSCLGILNLSKKYDKERLNNACKRAIYFGSYSCRVVKNILEKGLDRIAVEDKEEMLLPLHENVRESGYFQ